MWSKLTRVVVLLLGLSFSLSAQYYYEKNKIQREVEPTFTYETEHFSIYIEEGGEPLAKFAADVLEEAYAQQSSDLGFDVSVKIPVIVYKSQTDFAATNILLEQIEESVGGFSELFKNRIVVPFTGSYVDLYDVLYHELTHIFQYELYYSLALSNLFSIVPGFTPPLWIMEGSAEFCSNHGGGDSDAFMRDLLISNGVIPLEQFEFYSGYIVYRQGESVFMFIEERYGRKKVFELLHAIRLRRNMDGAFQKVFGMNVEEFGKDWMNWLRLKYLPDIKKLENLEAQARLLTDHEKDFSYYNGSVALSSSGTKIAYATSKGDYLTVNVISAFDGKHLKKILKAGKSATFERLPLLRKTLTWSPDETHLAVVGFSKNKPVLLWVDYESGKIEKTYKLKGDDAYAPAISPDGRRAVYVGVYEGQSDIFSLDLSSGEIDRLTYDTYYESDPSFDDQAVVYVSDRPDETSTSQWEIGSYAVWKLLPSGRTQRISPRLSEIDSPYIINGQLTFVGPGFHLYSYNQSDSSLVKLTDWFEQIEEFSPSQSGKGAFLIYNNYGWDIAMLNGTVQSLASQDQPDSTNSTDLADSSGHYTYQIEEVDFEDFDRYRAAFSADYIYGSGGYSSLYGAIGDFSLGVSDMLGDHRFYLEANLYGDILYSNIVLTYWYLRHRVDFGIGGFQIADFYSYWVSDSTFNYVERASRGATALVSFPLTKFFRIETEVDGMAVTDKVYPDCYFNEIGQIICPDTSLISTTTRPLFQGGGWVVFDNAIWKDYTPMVGLRMRLGGYSSFLSSDKYQTVMADLRGYLPITRRASIALRTFGGASFGQNNEYFTLGGAYDVRGYSTYYPDIGSRVAFANLELRVPFVDRLDLSFPLPLSLGGIRGVVFTDAGVIWDRDDLGEQWPVLWDSSGLVDLKASYGAGFRWLFGYFMLKFDFARPYQKDDPDDRGWDVWRFHFRLGADF